MDNLENRVIGQDWIESERGWGIRPDGYTIHLSEEDRQQFIKEYWARMPSRVPDEYSRPEGKPVEMWVSDELYEKLQENKSEEGHGIWGAMNGYIRQDQLL